MLQRTELLSGSDYVTINSALTLRSELLSTIKDKADDPKLIKTMKKHMRAKFSKPFPVTKILVAAALLDPRCHHLVTVDEFLSKAGKSKSKFLSEETYYSLQEEDFADISKAKTTKKVIVETKPDKLRELAIKHSISLAASDSDQPREEKADNLLISIEKECLQYLNSVNVNSVSNTNLLGWWKSSATKFPHLAVFAKKILCIPATSTPSERVFSIAGLIYDGKRSSLSPITGNKLIFIHDNYQFCKKTFS